VEGREGTTIERQRRGEDGEAEGKPMKVTAKIVRG
jgi:hypothetical protein